ncbi:MAG: chemotaxis response regulator protein-glutamate methylesterase [Thermodesulfobacteriota bacterium]|nr:chemotaxis response regulator protein-glutamate methylesterase [Thermodesulfobacteriota bacterium]
MTDGKRLRVLVVDDTIVFRKIVSDVLSELSDIEVVGTANNGKIALSRISLLQPDLLILDIEMPEMNGLEVLEQIRKEFPNVGAIVLSTLTQKGGDITLKALELGAFDFIPKPQDGTMADNRKTISSALTPMMKAFSRHKEIRSILKGETSHQSEKSMTRKKIIDSAGVVKRMRSIARKAGIKSEIVGIGVSTGGPNALAEMLPRLPSNLGAPVLIVQHMPPIFTKSLANSLNSKCSMEVREAVDGQTIHDNTVLIAPGGKQMKVVAAADGKTRIVRITNDPPEHNCRPSVDYLFRSIAQHYVGRATGVIMTGMGSDGALGSKLMKRNGATVIAQDEMTSVVYGMPRETIDAGVVDVIAPLNRIADEIVRTVKN